MKQSFRTRRLTVSASMLAFAAGLSALCSLLPFLNLPFGGGFTIASMLPLVIVAYMYGTGWGLFTAFVYSVLQVLLDLSLGARGSTLIALFTPSSDSFMGGFAAVAILLIEYFLAFTLLGFGGVFRNRIRKKPLALCFGSVFALTLRYLCHILSGAVFYGAWAEWFFSQEGFYKIGEAILTHSDGAALAVIYSVFYNGLYMIPEILITALAALAVGKLPIIKKEV